ncbi:hypothetical protein ScPMuIL_009789 [Solemya velum]
MLPRKWFVVAAGFVLAYMAVGFSFTIGALFPDIMEEFDSATAQTIAVQSTNIATSSIICAVSGVVVHRYGLRRAGAMGILLSFLGLSSSYFANGIIYLIMSVGIITGTGASLMYLTAILATGQYFDKKHNAIAVACVLTGVSVGGLTLPMVMLKLTEYYGLQGALLVFSGLCLHCLVVLFAFKEYKSPPTHPDLHENDGGIINDLFQIFKCKVFITLTFAISTSIACIELLVITVVDYSRELGFSKEDGVFVLLLMNISNLFGRLFPGILKQLPNISVLAIPVVHCVVASMTMCLLTLVTSYWQLASLMCLGHFIHGGFYTIIPLSVIRLLPSRLVSLGTGILFSLLGVLEMTLGPAAGAVKDRYDSYHMAYYGAASCIVICSLLFSAIYISMKNPFTTREHTLNSGGETDKEMVT